MYNDVYHRIITISKITEASSMPTTWNGQIHTVRLLQETVIQELRMKHLYEHGKI